MLFQSIRGKWLNEQRVTFRDLQNDRWCVSELTFSSVSVISPSCKVHGVTFLLGTGEWLFMSSGHETSSAWHKTPSACSDCFSPLQHLGWNLTVSASLHFSLTSHLCLCKGWRLAELQYAMFWSAHRLPLDVLSTAASLSTPTPHSNTHLSFLYLCSNIPSSQSWFRLWP